MDNLMHTSSDVNQVTILRKILNQVRAGHSAPDPLKSILCGSSACVRACVCVSASKAINN